MRRFLQFSLLFSLMFLAACGPVLSTPAAPPAAEEPVTLPPQAAGILLRNPADTGALSGEVRAASLPEDLNQLAESILAQAAVEGLALDNIPLLEKNADYAMENDPLLGYYPWQFVQQLQVVEKNWQNGQRLERFYVLTRLLDAANEPAGYVLSILVRPDFTCQISTDEIRVAHFVFDEALLAKLFTRKQAAGYDGSPTRALEHLLNEELTHLNTEREEINNNKTTFVVAGAPDPAQDSLLGAYPDYIYIDEQLAVQVNDPQAAECYLSGLRAGLNSHYFIVTDMDIHPVGQ